MNITRLAAIAATSTTLALAALTARAQDPVEVDSFVFPEGTHMEMPVYPQSLSMSSREGMVEVNFMVDTEGKPFDPVVTSSYGPRAFEQAAVRALMRSSFKPAMQDGEPIIGSTSYRYAFRMEGEVRGASSSFVSRYRKFQNAIEAGDREKIEATLKDLSEAGSKNHYEEAFLNLARYTHAQLYLDEAAQMQYLDGALSYSNSSDDPVYFDDDQVFEMRAMLLRLQLTSNYFAEANATYELMRGMNEEQTTSWYGDAMAAIEAYETDETAYSIPVALNESGLLWFRFYKHHFYLTGGEGSFNEIQLWCDKRRLAFTLERDVSYDLPASLGQCMGNLIGDPGATASLIQH